MVEAHDSTPGLNLNVLVPAGTTPDAKLPVLVVRLSPASVQLLARPTLTCRMLLVYLWR